MNAPGLLGKDRAFWELTKPRPTLMACLAMFLGFFAAEWPPAHTARLLWALAGTFLLGGGAAAFNQYLERDADARMGRTAHRPLPSGRLKGGEVLAFSAGISAAGLFVLGRAVGGRTALVGLAMFVAYVFCYTPLKKTTPHSAWIGAFAGALPPVMGWTAARDAFGFEAFVLFAILYFWQFPHVLAIGWVYREDYRRGGFLTLASRDSDGRRTVRRILYASCVLFAVSLLPVLAGMSGGVYGWGAFFLGVFLVAATFFLTPARLDAQGKKYILASVIYLPLLLAFWALDRYV